MQKAMLETNSETEKAVSAWDTDIQYENKGHRSEPSFSGWCDENGIIHSTHSSKNADARIEDSDFELPLPEGDGLDNECLSGVAQKFQQRSMHIHGVHSVDNTASHTEGNGDETHYVACNIEIGLESQQKISQFDVDGAASGGTHKTVPDTQSPITVVIVLKTLFFVLVWYGFSTFLTLYNKTLLGDNLGKFPAPMLMNTVHFAMQAILSNAITWIWNKRFQPRVAMSWRDYFIRVVPTALGTALDVNLSNASLVFISVTFATMCKSASPIFLLLFAFAFRLETPSFKLLGIMLIISVGVLLTVAKETEFDFWGFIFIMLAALMSGFRWSMTQILLQREVYGLKNPLTLMSYVAPVMAISTALLSLTMDPWHKFKENKYFNDSWHVIRSILLMLFGGTLAFFMVLTEYILVSVTSAVTVTIAGVVKEAVTILVAVLYFHDQFTWLKGIGLVIIIAGVGLFNWYKYQNLQKHHGSENDEAGPLSTSVAAKYVILEEMEDQEDA